LKHKSIITDIVYDATAPNFPKDFFVNDLNFKGDLKFLWICFKREDFQFWFND